MTTLETLYMGFQENFNRTGYSTKRLCKQFNALEEEVIEAKKLFRLNSNDFTTAQAMNIIRDGCEDSTWCGDYKPILGKTYYTTYKGFLDEITNSISKSEQPDDTIDSAFTQEKVKQKFSEAGKKWGEITRQGVNESYKELSSKYLKDALNQAWDSNQNPYSGQWEVKQKWVKSKEGSQLLVKKSQEVDYKKEFQEFIAQYKSRKTIDCTFRRDKKDTGKLAIICLFDIHLGKIAHFSYTNNEDNLESQEESYSVEFLKLYEFIKTQNIEQIYLPIGNDLFNVDNTRLTTVKGTNQDNTIDLHGMFKLGLELVTETIDILSQLCKVNVVLVPGNHASTVETYLALALDGIYRNNSKVSVDTDPVPRKYFQWGKNCISFSHGELPLKEYARLLPFEAKEMFSSCDHFEVLVGDKHVEEIYRTPVLDGQGVTVRRLGALTKTDKWHFLNGLTLSKRRSYVLVYDKEHGLELQYTNHAD